MIHFPIFFRVASQPMGQSYDSPSTSKVTMKDILGEGLHDATTSFNPKWDLRISESPHRSCHLSLGELQGGKFCVESKFKTCKLEQYFWYNSKSGLYSQTGPSCQWHKWCGIMLSSIETIYNIEGIDLSSPNQIWLPSPQAGQVHP